MFAAPIGDGHAPLVALKDIAFWVRHVFDHPDTTTGKDLEIASDVFTWDELVATFTKVTGKKAVYKRLTLDEFFDCMHNPDLTAATHAARPAGSWRKTIGGLWALLRDDVLTRDMDWIRSVHPNSLTLEEWMRETNYDGSFAPLLKLIGTCYCSLPLSGSAHPLDGREALHRPSASTSALHLSDLITASLTLD